MTKLTTRIKILLATLLVFPAFVAFAPVTPPAQAATCGPAPFTLLPPWYKGLDKGCGQGIMSPKDYGKGLNGYIFKIALNIIEALLYVTGYVSLGFIIWGGFKFMIYGDNSSGVASARKTIQNAVIGLVLSIFSVAIVNVVSGAF
jgi:hypothetical protein